MARISSKGDVRATCASFLGDLASGAGVSSHEKIGSAARTAVASVFERLEDRRLMSSIALSSGVLKIVGDGTYNNLSVATSGSNLVAKTNSLTKYYSASSVGKIVIHGGWSGDKITIASNVYKASYVNGNGGNDTIAGGSGRDWLYGGSGNDKIAGFSRDDVLRGYDGNDSLYGGAGNDVVEGNAGTDTINYDTNGGLSNTTTSSTPTKPSTSTPTTSSGSISLSSGVLKIVGASGVSNTISALVSGANIAAKVNGGATKYFAASSVWKIEVHGSSRNDWVKIDSALPDHTYVKTYEGNDTVKTAWGNDTVYAGSGADYVSTYGGNDRVYGEADNDSLYGGSGTDVLDGGAGTDTINQDGTGSGTAPAPTPAPGATPSDSGDGIAPVARITALATSVPAGHAIHVHGLGSTLNAGNPTNARYHWDFGNSGSKYNTLVGYNAGHVYESPGSYTITLTVTNSNGRTSTTRQTVNITSASRRVIYVSSAGSDSNDGSSSRPVRSFSRASSMVNSNTEVRFRRGDTFGVYGSMAINDTNVVIGAYGSGNKPVLKWSAGMPEKWPEFIGVWGGTNVRVDGLTFDTPFGGTDKTHLTAVRFGGRNVTITNNEFRNIDEGTNGNGNPQGVLVQDNSAPLTTGLRGGIAWASGKDLVYLGNYVANSTRENVLRISTELQSYAPVPERILIAHNNLTNLDRSSVDRNDFLKGTIVVQKSKYAYVTGNTVRDGWIQFGPLGGGDGLVDKGGRTYWAVADGNKVNETSIRVHHGAEHVMLRNNIVDHYDNDAIVIDDYSSEYGRGVRDVTIVNNTSYLRGRSGTFLRLNGEASGIALLNNLFINPNMEAGQGGAASVYVNDSNLNSFSQITNNIWGMPHINSYAQGGINYVYSYWSNSAGYKTSSEWNGYGVVGTDYFSDVPLSSTYTPSGSSIAASGSKDYGGVFADFNGRIRPSSNYAIGAIEV